MNNLEQAREIAGSDEDGLASMMLQISQVAAPVCSWHCDTFRQQIVAWRVTTRSTGALSFGSWQCLLVQQHVALGVSPLQSLGTSTHHTGTRIVGNKHGQTRLGSEHMIDVAKHKGYRRQR